MELMFLNEKITHKLFLNKNQDIRNYVAKVISLITGESYEELKDNLKLNHFDFEEDNGCCLSFYDGKTFYGIDINYNGNSNVKVFKHFCNLISTQLDFSYGDYIKPVKVISFCARYDRKTERKKLIHKVYVQDKDGVKYTKDFMIYDIDLLYYRDIDFDMILQDELLKTLLVFVNKDDALLLEILKDNKEAFEFISILKRLKCPYLSIEDMEEFEEVLDLVGELWLKNV